MTTLEPVLTTRGMATLPTMRSCQRLGLSGCVNRVIESFTTGLVVADLHGRILLVNNAASRLFDRAADDLIGGSVGALFGFADEPITFLEDCLRAGGSRELRIHAAGGREHVLSVSVAQVSGLEHEGDDRQYSVMLEDISPWAHLREERDRLLQLATVGAVMPSILHEVKNPLAGITTVIELLIEDTKDASVRADLHAVLGEVRRIKLSLDGIGAVGRKLASPRFEAIDFAIHEAFRVLEPRMKAASINATCDVPVMPLLPLDPAVVRAIVFNLLTNAIHACSERNIVRLSAKLLDNGTTLELSVADTGAGMSPETLANCTTLFFTTKSHGSGIGLALCRNAAEQAGGSLSVESTLGQGTRITLRVPLNGRPPKGANAS